MRFFIFNQLRVRILGNLQGDRSFLTRAFQGFVFNFGNLLYRSEFSTKTISNPKHSEDQAILTTNRMPATYVYNELLLRLYIQHATHSPPSKPRPNKSVFVFVTNQHIAVRDQTSCSYRMWGCGSSANISKVSQFV